MGNLTMASTLTTARDLMGFKKISEFTSIGGDISPKQLAQLNRLLSRVILILNKTVSFY